MDSPTSELRVPYSGSFEMGIRAYRWLELPNGDTLWVERWERDGDCLVLTVTRCRPVKESP